MLQHQIEVFKSFGVFDIHVVGGYLAKKIVNPDIKLHVNEDFESTNMVSTLFKAREALEGNEDLIVSYGDIVFEPEVLRRLLKCNATVGVVSDEEWLRYWRARFSNPLVDAETFRVDGSGSIIALGDQPMSIDEVQGQFIGLLKIQGDALSRLKSAWSSLQSESISTGADRMFMTDFLQHLIREGWEIIQVPIQNGWAEIDSPHDLEVASTFFQPQR